VASVCMSAPSIWGRAVASRELKAGHRPSAGVQDARCGNSGSVVSHTATCTQPWCLPQEPGAGGPATRNPSSSLPVLSSSGSPAAPPPKPILPASYSTCSRPRWLLPSGLPRTLGSPPSSLESCLNFFVCSKVSRHNPAGLELAILLLECWEYKHGHRAWPHGSF
jgi:hypothetical protein